MIRQRWAHLCWVVRLLGRRGRALHVLHSWASEFGCDYTADQLTKEAAQLGEDWEFGFYSVSQTIEDGEVSGELMLCIEQLPEVPYD